MNTNTIVLNLNEMETKLFQQNCKRLFRSLLPKYLRYFDSCGMAVVTQFSEKIGRLLMPSPSSTAYIQVSAR